MTPEERAEKIELYGRGFELLIAALQELPREMWQFKPSPDDWSIHEIIIHLGDSESNSFGRFRAGIAEPKLTLMAYNQDLWAKQLSYHNQNWEDALQLLKFIRKLTYDLIKIQPEYVWANTIYHPEQGEITLDKVLETYADHIPGHIQQMRDNYAAWLRTRG